MSPERFAVVLRILLPLFIALAATSATPTAHAPPDPPEFRGIRARTNGLILETSRPLPEGLLGAPSSWHIEREAIDGGGALEPASILVAPDRSRVFLELPDLRRGDVVRVRLQGGPDPDGAPTWSVEVRHIVVTLEPHDGPDFVPRALPPRADPESKAEILFDGTSLDAFTARDGAAPEWRIRENTLEVVAGRGDLLTRAGFEDVLLHLEWLSPPGGSGQSAGNSGVKLQSRYEVQILNTPPEREAGTSDAGAVYHVAPPRVNASRGAGRWQAFDIFFKAARWEGDVKIADALITVYWNGVLIHDELPIARSTGSSGLPEKPGPHPVLLQEHFSRAEGPVRFRNVWALRTPADLSYGAASITAVSGEAISPRAPALAGGAPDGFISMPPLPEGLSLGWRDGTIRGTPRRTGSSEHEITAFNAAGSARCRVVVQVTEER